jgi:hypothetical protein
LSTEESIQNEEETITITDEGSSHQMEVNNSTESSSNQQQPAVIASTSSAPLTTDVEEMTTLEDLRNKLYILHQGYQHISVLRDNFFEELFGVYKDPSFNINQKPKVRFAGEAG